MSPNISMYISLIVAIIAAIIAIIASFFGISSDIVLQTVTRYTALIVSVYGVINAAFHSISTQEVGPLLKWVQRSK
jgi:uncharacterized membrane protein